MQEAAVIATPMLSLNIRRIHEAVRLTEEEVRLVIRQGAKFLAALDAVKEEESSI